MKLKFLKNNLSLALNVSLILVLAFTIWVLCLAVKNHREYVRTHIVVTQEFLDSLEYVANLPPIVIKEDTIIYDTIIIKEQHYPEPEPDPTDSTNVYYDSLKIKDEVDVNVRFKVDGTLVGAVYWNYTPICKIETVTNYIPKPYPVPYEVPVIKYRTGTYISFVGNNIGGKPFIGTDIDFVTKKEYIWGLEYKKGFDGTNVYGFKVGFKLNKLFKR